MTEREQLEQAIEALEDQRDTLGDAVVDPALASMRERLSSLAEQAGKPEVAAQSERRIVTVLFCDVTGSTAMAETMDPEEWTGIMNNAFADLIEPIYRYGGTVSRLLGDGILAFFGAPLSHEDDPERACRAALEMIEGAQSYAAHLQQERGLASFNVRVGVNTGLVIAGQVGSEQRGEYTAMGDTVNVAARFEGAAEPGTILIGQDTYRLVTNVAETEALGSIHVKGKTETVPVHRLVAMRARPKREDYLASQSISSPLVGRQTELAVLNDCLLRLREGKGGIVTITGEAGLGKTRLVSEFQQQALIEDKPASTLWLEGHTLSYGQSISYWPFHEILWRYAGITEEDGETVAWDKLEARIKAMFAERAAEILPYLASMLAIEIREEYADRVRFLDGDAMRSQIFRASYRFFERLTQDKSVVLVFEDLHWADESTTLLLEHLLPLTQHVPLLVCAISRPVPNSPSARLSDLASADGAIAYSDLRLNSLSSSDSAALLSNLAQIEGLLPRVRQMIVDKSDGNPFFLEEIIRALVDDGSIVLDQTTGMWQATGRIEQITIPDNIQGVIVARLDRLTDDVKWTLRTASVIGRSFLFRLLHAVAEDDRFLEKQIGTLQAQEFIRENQRLPELEYIFKHALAQEATYESILLEKRRELHGRVGEAIEVLFTERLEEFYGLLAYHYARAELWEKAQDYLLKAGDQAIALAADAEALNFYRQALQTFAQTGGEEWGPIQRATLERKMGLALHFRGDFEQAQEVFLRALGYLDLSLPTTTWGVRLALIKEIVVQGAHRLVPRLFLASSYVSAAGKAYEEFRIYRSLMWLDIVVNNERFLMTTLRTLNRAERAGYAWEIAGASMSLGFVMTMIPWRNLPLGYYRRALVIAEQIQAVEITGWTYHCQAWNHAFQGNLERALALSQRAAKISKITGDLQGWSFPRFQIATIFSYKGHHAQALAQCQELIVFGRESAASQVLCWGLAALGFLQLRKGQLDEAVVASKEAAGLAQSIPDNVFNISTNADLGRAYLRQGRLSDALDALESSKDAFVDFLGGDSYVSLRNGLAEAHLAAAEQNFHGDGSRWLKQSRKSCRDALNLGKKFRPGMPEAMRLQGTYEWLKGKRTAAQKWWQRSLAEAEDLGQPYDRGRAHQEMGSRLNERTHLEQAADIFSDLGAELDLVLAKKALEAHR